MSAPPADALAARVWRPKRQRSRNPFYRGGVRAAPARVGDFDPRNLNGRPPAWQDELAADDIDLVRLVSGHQGHSATGYGARGQLRVKLRKAQVVGR